MNPVARVVAGLGLAFFVTILAARLAFEATTAGGKPGAQPWAQNSMQFVSWNGEQWTTWIRGGRFELVPRDTGDWSRHSNASLAFVDWHGEPWQAKVDDKVFVLARRGDWRAPTERAGAIRYRDWQGKNQLRTVPQLMR